VGLLLATNSVHILVFSNLAIKVNHTFYDTSKLLYDSRSSLERSLTFRLLNCKSLYSNNKELTLLWNIQFGSATLIQDPYYKQATGILFVSNYLSKLFLQSLELSAKCTMKLYSSPIKIFILYYEHCIIII
jgi:hypothetical protein